MDILICGTAAAEGWPALFCICEACIRAREMGGKNIRTRAAYMVDDRVRVDFGPDSYLHQLKYGLDYSRLEHLLISHAHSDHWYPTDLHFRRKGYSDVGDRSLTLWGNAKVERRFEEANGDHFDSYRVVFRAVRPWQSMDLGDGVVAIPVQAAHDTSEECINYILEKDGRRLLIGHDTGWYDELTWRLLGDYPLDAVVMDCTYGPNDHSRGHLGCASVVRARDEMVRRGILRADGAMIAGHFSHNGGWLHEDLERYFEPQGILVAYDGMRFTV